MAGVANAKGPNSPEARKYIQECRKRIKEAQAKMKEWDTLRKAALAIKDTHTANAYKDYMHRFGTLVVEAQEGAIKIVQKHGLLNDWHPD